MGTKRGCGHASDCSFPLDLRTKPDTQFEDPLELFCAIEPSVVVAHSVSREVMVHRMLASECVGENTDLLAKRRLRLRTKPGDIKITACSADKIQFDGHSCVLAVSEDIPSYEPAERQANRDNPSYPEQKSASGSRSSISSS